MAKITTYIRTGAGAVAAFLCVNAVGQPGIAAKIKSVCTGMNAPAVCSKLADFAGENAWLLFIFAAAVFFLAVLPWQRIIPMEKKNEPPIGNRPPAPTDVQIPRAGIAIIGSINPTIEGNHIEGYDTGILGMNNQGGRFSGNTVVTPPKKLTDPQK